MELKKYVFEEDTNNIIDVCMLDGYSYCGFTRHENSSFVWTQLVKYGEQYPSDDIITSDNPIDFLKSDDLIVIDNCIVHVKKVENMMEETGRIYLMDGRIFDKNYPYITGIYKKQLNGDYKKVLIYDNSITDTHI